MSQYEETKNKLEDDYKPQAFGVKGTVKPLSLEYGLVFEAIKLVLTSSREITITDEKAIVGTLRA